MKKQSPLLTALIGIGTSLFLSPPLDAGYETIIIVQQMDPNPVSVTHETTGKVDLRYVDDLNSLNVENRSRTIEKVTWLPLSTDYNIEGESDFQAWTPASPSPFSISGGSGSTTNGVPTGAEVKGSPTIPGYWRLKPNCMVRYSGATTSESAWLPASLDQRFLRVRSVAGQLGSLTATDATHSNRVASAGGTLQMVQASLTSSRSATLAAASSTTTPFAAGEPTWQGASSFTQGNATQSWTGEEDITAKATAGGVEKSVGIDLVLYDKKTIAASLQTSLDDGYFALAKTIINKVTGVTPTITASGQIQSITETVDAYASPNVATKRTTQGGVTLGVSVQNIVATVPIPAFPLVSVGVTGSIGATAQVSEVAITLDSSKPPAEAWSPGNGTITGKLEGSIGVIVKAGNDSVLAISGIAALQTGGTISATLVETSPGHVAFVGNYGTSPTTITFSASVYTKTVDSNGGTTTYTWWTYKDEIGRLLDGQTNPLNITVM